jgi:hypothetical protein
MQPTDILLSEYLEGCLTHDNDAATKLKKIKINREKNAQDAFDSYNGKRNPDLIFLAFLKLLLDSKKDTAVITSDPTWHIPPLFIKDINSKITQQSHKGLTITLYYLTGKAKLVTRHFNASCSIL